MPTYWQVESLQSRIFSLEAEIKRVADKDHPYPEPDIIYNGLLAVMREKLEHFRFIKDLWFSDIGATQFLAPNDDRKAQVLFDDLVKDLQRIAEVFSLADRVDSARIPFEILRSLSWVASSLLDEDCRTVVRLDTVYNYSIASCRRKFEELGWDEMWLEATANNDGRPTPSTVLVLGFPSSDAGSILVHTLAAHEFGHEIAYKSLKEIREIVFQAVVDMKQQYNEQLQEYVADTVVMHEGISKDDAYEKSRKLVDARLLQVTDNWIQEIFADLFASRLVGPAFLAAFDRILLRLGEPNRTHPPGYLRREIVQTYLSQICSQIVEDPVWEPFFNSLVSRRGTRTADIEPFVISEIDFDSSVNIIDASSQGADNGIVKGDDPLLPLYPMVENICLQNLEKLSQILITTRSPLMETADLSGILSHMEENIDNLSPPSVGLDLQGVDSDSNYFWLLMYAAWRYRLNDKKFVPFANNHVLDGAKDKAEEILGNLILHSLQSIEFRFHWLTANTNPDEGGGYVA